MGSGAVLRSEMIALVVDCTDAIYDTAFRHSTYYLW